MATGYRLTGAIRCFPYIFTDIFLPALFQPILTYCTCRLRVPGAVLGRLRSGWAQGWYKCYTRGRECLRCSGGRRKGRRAGKNGPISPADVARLSCCRMLYSLLSMLLNGFVDICFRSFNSFLLLFVAFLLLSQLQDLFFHFFSSELLIPSPKLKTAIPPAARPTSPILLVLI